MRKPDESLDEFVVKAKPEIIAEPPRTVTLRFTGEVQVLKPLATAYVRRASNRLLWFHRSLAVGGGLAVIALVFASAVFIGMYEDIRQTELVQVADVEIATPPEKRSLLAEDPAVPNVAPDVVAAIPTSEPSTPVIKLSVPRHQRASQPATDAPLPVAKLPSQTQLAVSDFVPTTLVIYIDKGEIKTRIEPQAPGHKTKSSTF